MKLDLGISGILGRSSLQLMNLCHYCDRGGSYCHTKLYLLQLDFEYANVPVFRFATSNCSFSYILRIKFHINFTLIFKRNTDK